MSKKSHFTLLGVPVRLHPRLLLWIIIYGPIGYAIARWRGIEHRKALIIGLSTVISWYHTDLMHVIGHIISARLAKASMDYVKWDVMPITGYYDHNVSPQQHIGRSLGGPIASALTALFYYQLRRWSKPKLLKAIFTPGYIQNLLISILCFLPDKRIDGGVIYYNIRELLSPRRD